MFENYCTALKEWGGRNQTRSQAGTEEMTTFYVGFLCLTTPHRSNM